MTRRPVPWTTAILFAAFVAIVLAFAWVRLA